MYDQQGYRVFETLKVNITNDELSIFSNPENSLKNINNIKILHSTLQQINVSQKLILVEVVVFFYAKNLSVFVTVCLLPLMWLQTCTWLMYADIFPSVKLCSIRTTLKSCQLWRWRVQGERRTSYSRTLEIV